MSEALKLTVYFGESDRVGTRLVSDALLDLYDRAEVRASVLLRGTEGFGLKHRLHTQRLLTLSEDLPLVAVAVDERSRIERLLPDATALLGDGLATLERARFDDEERVDEPTKLSIFLGRNEPYRHVTEVLRRNGVAGATVLLGLDGTVHGDRRRARFLSRNTDVPLLLVSVGDGAAIDAALPELRALLRDPLLTLERIRVCKRDGAHLAEPRHMPEADESGLPIWQKLMVYAGEQARHAGHPLYVELVRRLREAGAAGATSLRGVWGYSGDHAPHGESLLSLRRTVPVVTTIVDRPPEIQRWFRIVDELTDEAGLVTSELVPAAQLRAPGHEAGGIHTLANLGRR